jgi:hypothetical protein
MTSESSESSSLGNPGAVTEADYASDVDTEGEGAMAIVYYCD